MGPNGLAALNLADLEVPLGACIDVMVNICCLVRSYVVIGCNAVVEHWWQFQIWGVKLGAPWLSIDAIPGE